ncbi:MAG: hypothetical protein IJ665_07995 [Phocaeicola sp.]|nr:hypothetical protein [Phocaeicola sp.]
MKKVFNNIELLVIIQVIGMALCAWMKFHDVTPISDLMGRSSRWDVTVDLIWILFICGPAVYAYTHRLAHRKIPILMAFLPFVFIGLAVLYFGSLNAYHHYQAKQLRKQQYNTPAKIEQVIGVPVPDFKLTKYEEYPIDNKYLKGHLCKAEISFINTPTDKFYQTLDSLCSQNNSIWVKNDHVYLMDSIQGRGNLSRIFLSLLHTKGEKIAYLEYHKVNNNFLINRRK